MTKTNLGCRDGNGDAKQWRCNQVFLNIMKHVVKGG